MKKTIAGLMALTLFAVSCSDDDNPTPEPTETDVYALTGWDIKFADDDTTFYRITYNADSTVKETKEWDKGKTDTSFEYASYLDGKMVKLETKDGAKEKELNMAFFYKDGRLAGISHYSGGTLYEYDTLYYNAAGKVSEVHTISQVQPENNNRKRIVTWTGGNISKVETYHATGGVMNLEETEVYTVDDRPNLFAKVLKDDYLWKTDGMSFEYLGENNVVKVEGAEEGTDSRNVRTATFTYDESNRLQKISNLLEFYEGETLDDSYQASLVFRYEKR